MVEHDCSVCLEAITAATSSATLACGHRFHFGCLGTWINKSGNESCPYCRHKLEEKEQILAEDSDEQSDNSAYDAWQAVELRDANQRDWLASMRLQISFVNHNPIPLAREVPKLEIPKYDEEAHSMWMMRKTFELAESGQPLTVESAVEPPLHNSDKSAKLRKRKTPFGRTTWSHIGSDYKLTVIEPDYNSD